MIKYAYSQAKIRPIYLSKRMLTFEGSTHVPLTFTDLTNQQEAKQMFKETSRQLKPQYRPLPSIISKSSHIPAHIIHDLTYLSKPPVSPDAADCCGSGCEDNCVFVIYYNEFKHWKKKRHDFLDFMLKEESQNIINKEEYEAMLHYMGLNKDSNENQTKNVVWPAKLKPGQWESPPLVHKKAADLLTKEHIVEDDIVSKIPLEILQYDRLEQKLKEKRRLRAAKTSLSAL